MDLLYGRTEPILPLVTVERTKCCCLTSNWYLQILSAAY